MAILWGLAAAFALGIADFVAREAGNRVGSLTTLLYVQLIGSPIAIVIVIICTNSQWIKLNSPFTLLAIVSGIQLILGNMLFYQALVKGPLLIVAPITSSFAIVTIFLSLLSGERLNLLQLLGIIITLTGILLATITSKEVLNYKGTMKIQRDSSWISSGVALAIVAAILFGFSFWLMKYATLQLGSLMTVLILRQTALIVMIIMFLFMHRSLPLIPIRSLKLVSVIAILDTSANIFINMGLVSGYTSIVSVITSLYSVVTIILGIILLRERITGTQQLAVGFTLAGVVLVSI